MTSSGASAGIASASASSARAGDARVMRRDRGPEPARAGVDEQPELALCVAIELEEVVAAPERREVAPDERLARPLERARGERRREQRLLDGEAATAMDRVPHRDGGREAREQALERLPIAERVP